jgi:hypothetical protein
MYLQLAIPLLFSVLFPVPAEVHESVKVYTPPPYTVECSCVQYAISLGADIPLVDASRIPATTSQPYIGATAVFYYPDSGLHHVAVVTAVQDDSFTVHEANYLPCEAGTRLVSLDDRRLLGFR